MIIPRLLLDTGDVHNTVSKGFRGLFSTEFIGHPGTQVGAVCLDGGRFLLVSILDRALDPSNLLPLASVLAIVWKAHGAALPAP